MSATVKNERTRCFPFKFNQTTLRKWRPGAEHVLKTTQSFIITEFFLFGARGTGKSTLLKSLFSDRSDVLWIDLLNLDEEDAFAKNHNLLEQRLAQSEIQIERVVIDEVQKFPRMLDTVHRLIENAALKFALTGSSARKLKAGGANLLAGRALVNSLFPLTHLEMTNLFDLESTLRWGSLPIVVNSKNEIEKAAILRSYGQTYLKEEVWGEQLVRNLEPFRRFLEVAAQNNGKIVSFLNIALDVGADEKTIKNYFSVLEDTLLGFFLEPFKHSFRKRLSQKPKFLLILPRIRRSQGR